MHASVPVSFLVSCLSLPVSVSASLLAVQVVTLHTRAGVCQTHPAEEQLKHGNRKRKETEEEEEEFAF